MLDHNTGRSRGFGFVTFDNEDAVQKVLSDGRMHELNGKQVSYLTVVGSDVFNFCGKEMNLLFCTYLRLKLRGLNQRELAEIVQVKAGCIVATVICIHMAM